MGRRLALYASNELTRLGLRGAAERAGLQVVGLTAEPQAVVDADGPEVSVRAPGGLVAGAIRLGAPIRLFGPTAEWFAALGSEVTGRTWHLVGQAGARELLAEGPAFIKLADAKHPDFPARRFTGVADFDAAVAALRADGDIQLLATSEWLSIESEYRVFSAGCDVLTVSPYRVEDEPWSQLLHTHRASFHREAAAFIARTLRELPDDSVPPGAALDVARLTGGQLILLEANQSWGVGLSGCGPDEALVAILAAGAPAPDRWRYGVPTRPSVTGTAPERAHQSSTYCTSVPLRRR